MSILCMFAGAVAGALLLRHSLAFPLGVATVLAVCGVAAFYRSSRLGRGDTSMSGKVPKDEHLAYLERPPARDRATEVSPPSGDQPLPTLREKK